MRKVKSKTYQLKGGAVAATALPRGAIRIFGPCFGLRENVSIEMSAKDAKDLQCWFNLKWPKDPLKQIGEYIESHGWKVAVIGPAQIRQQPGAFKYNYEFVVGFTGVKKEHVPNTSVVSEGKGTG